MPQLTIDEIMKLLPHRYPFLMVDRIVELDVEAKRVVALKNVTVNEPFFQGHFPGLPVMPGVLQLEAMAQAGGVLLVTLLQTTDIIPYFMSIDRAKFRRIVKPGDQLLIEATITTMRSKLAKIQAVVRVGDDIASEAELMCMITHRQADD